MQYFQGDKELSKAVWDAAVATGAITGVPATNIAKSIIQPIENVTGEKD